MGDDRGVRSEDSVVGRTDVLSSSGTGAASADHLVIMVHGILGSMDDWKFAADQFFVAHPERLIVHCSECNVNRLTLDGVDVMGERLAEEVITVSNQRPEVRKISFVAHSVGGLVARYAIGKLYTPPERTAVADMTGGCVCGENTMGRICGLEAMNFVTVATPHLGSRGNKQVPFLFGVSAFEKTASLIIHWIFRRTGRHLFLTDCDRGDRPLLQRMVNDCDDLCFMSALRAFKRRVAYSNACYDHIVGWRTSSIRRNSELPKWEDSLSEMYPHIVYEEYSKEDNIEKNAELSTVELSAINGPSDQIEEELVTGLTKVSWERVDVSFHGCKKRFAAHSVIQVKNTYAHSEGADVIHHMIDRFHV